jgi:hypothetical protein
VEGRGYRCGLSCVKITIDNTMRDATCDTVCESERTSECSPFLIMKANVSSTKDYPERPPTSTGIGEELRLRKRSIECNLPAVELSTYNSAFLSGLFADIANSCGKNPFTEKNSISPKKKSRLSLVKSISRCEKSHPNFDNLQFSAESEFNDSKNKIMQNGMIQLQPRKHSVLLSRLNSMKSSIIQDVLHFNAEDVGKLGFPQLPATVSTTSCSISSRRNSVQRFVDDETDSKESYGWFVAFDDECEEAPGLSSVSSVSSASSSSLVSDLAFTAITAPKRSVEYDAELEWAKAADTVDDVLGDFF